MSDIPNAFSQWVVLQITNSLRSRPLKIQNAKLIWGKFHQNGDRDVELSPEEIDKIVILVGSEQSVSSSARETSPNGTEGTIDLYDDITKVCTLYWNCPWNAVGNNFEVRDVNKPGGYIVSNGPWDPTGGPLGRISIEVAIKG
ncbi:putative Asp-hemolysin precursor [Hygrophoropsis aurantiaca]|uniref:Asp-hemolysin n=1 Tax=Hygrophoropsis aurantiaca TaxID=72124 RepID=A0ACB8A1M1_9AGAM|nr:putative Asp-hemolysin precursor [Hygrophoropsis aurantiaca]